MAFLEVKKMTHNFGGLRAVHNYNLHIELGQIRGLIGPNLTSPMKSKSPANKIWVSSSQTEPYEM